MMLNRFYFRGFQPEMELESGTDAALAELRRLAPSDSSFLGSVEKLPDGYIARLDIYSMHGPFMADITAEKPDLALTQVIERIKKQLESWQKRRSNWEQAQTVRDHYSAPTTLE